MGANYDSGKIYKLSIQELVYYGSTTRKYLCQRFGTHVTDYKRWKDGEFHYMTSFDLFERGKPEITLMELFPCKTKDELHARERYYIENNVCVNKIIPGRTKKEYAKANKEKVGNYMKTYYQNHKTKILADADARYLNNADVIKEKVNNYRELNFDKIHEQISCNCGGTYIYKHKSTHFKTKKHIEFTNL
jgi:hypothetical protein